MEAVRATILSAMAMFGLTGGCLDPGDPGNLVPPTADEDPRLPQLAVDVAGRSRVLHLEALGDPSAPALFVLHGSFTDYRGLRPLAVELSSRYHVVIWDQRGAGLSERIDEGEFSIDSAIEEIEAVREVFAPNEPVTLVGHSWGGGLATAYVSRHPSRVHQLVLVEPMPLDAALMNEQAPEIIELSFFNEGWNDQIRMDQLLASGGHETLDYRAALTLRSGMTQYFCDQDHPPTWPIWRVGGYLERLRNLELMDGREFVHDFTEGLEEFTPEVLIVGGECGALGAEFQRRQVELFANARVEEIAGVGHRMFVERPQAVHDVIEAYLDRFEGMQ